MAWWQILITVGSVLTAGGIIYKFITDWGGKLVQKMAKYGVKDELYRLQKMANENTALLKAIKSELDSNTRLTLKLELKSLFRNHPECVQVIELTMEKYKSLGGDSYIDTLYEEWKDTFERPKMHVVVGSGAVKTVSAKKKASKRK